MKYYDNISLFQCNNNFRFTFRVYMWKYVLVTIWPRKTIL